MKKHKPIDKGARYTKTLPYYSHISSIAAQFSEEYMRAGKMNVVL